MEKNIMKKWYNHIIEDWGGTQSDEFKEFAKDYKKYLTNVAKEINAELVSFSPNHYDFSAFLKRDNNYIYLSILDVRYFLNSWRKDILIRRAKDEHDYTGEENCYTDLEHLKDNLDALFISTKEFNYRKYQAPRFRGLTKEDFIEKYGFFDEKHQKWAVKSYEIERGKENIVNGSREGESFGTIITEDVEEIYNEEDKILYKNNYSYDGKSYDRVTVYERKTIYPSKEDMGKDLFRLFKQYLNYYEENKDIRYSRDYCQFIPDYNRFESNGEYTFDSREKLEKNLAKQGINLSDIYEFYQVDDLFEYVCDKLDNFDSVKEKRDYLKSLNSDQIKELRDCGFGLGTEYGYALFYDDEQGYHIEKIDEMNIYDGDDSAAEYAIKDNMVNPLINEALNNLDECDYREKYKLESLRFNLLDKNINASSDVIINNLQKELDASKEEIEKIETKSAILDTLLEADAIYNYNDEYVELLRNNGFEDEDIKEAGFEINNENLQEYD